ncbi:MAG TPA: FMN-binding negative transcriptional regulator [Polaromonas sp.]|uniref:FMN-binding negative transcriptional regulator n=1 Tax=Polaromonas sp. TaxID=1869339 RepID=UPI002D4A35F9|nr:FMN-binding negative transcriptional regulator [Polaromonas sp.]HYW58076.1 FMN-binding negative transcriptional regulator [Polaromonas sp.]
MTYLPPHFAETDTATLHALVRAHPLATWVVQHQGELLVNHIPMLLDPDRGEHGTLVGHVARANPVWQALAAGAQSVAVFAGPQAYVSPNWYPSKHAHGKAVPTWNYATVHAHGVPQAFDDTERVLDVVTRLTRTHEASQALPWHVSDAPADYITQMLKAIVGVEMPVQRWIGKWKVSQNRPASDQHGIAAGLSGQSTPAAAEMAALVQQKIKP